jgi:hypothetical protein
MHREGISYLAVYDDPETGLMMYRNKGRPSKREAAMKLNCPEHVQEAAKQTRKELSYDDGKKLMLLFSLATDEMIRLVMMYPEVIFMDVTGQTNRQKKDLFIAAIKDSVGQVFPGNITVIPSGKAWVFMLIFQHAFPFLFGEGTVSMNRLGLTDEDASEYGAFENCIESVAVYKDSKLMICTFHAIWQPFKEGIYPVLPRDTPGGELSDVGRLYGE